MKRQNLLTTDNKIAWMVNLNNTLDSPTKTSQTKDIIILKGVDNNSSKTCFLSYSDKDCGIMHAPISEIEIPGLPSIWELDSGTVNCIQLECEHCFHASALCVHFMSHNMTCPVCRDGFACKLKSTSLPKQIRHVFMQHCAGITERSEQEEINVMVNINMNFEAIMRDWTVLAHIHETEENLAIWNNTFQRDVTIITSRLRLPTREQVLACIQNLQSYTNADNSEIISNIENDSSLIPVFIQNSFMRHLNITYRRNQVLQIQFHMHHPMAAFTFKTVVPFAIADICNPNGTITFKALIHDGLHIGYVTNSSAQPSSCLLCHTDPTQNVMLWLRIDLMTQCIVGQIQEHLSNQLSNDFNVSSHNQSFFNRNTIH